MDLLAVTVTTTPDPDKVSPGFAGFTVIFLLAIATILLVRSMTKHLRRVRYSPDPANPAVNSEPAVLQNHRQDAGDVVDDQGIHPGGQ